MVQCPFCQNLNPDDVKMCQSCGAPLDVGMGTPEPSLLNLPPNTALNNGRYIIEKVLGAGGFGITYSAIDKTLQRKVAIKEFFPNPGCSRQGRSVFPVGNFGIQAYQEAKQEFIKEAQLLARLNHPHIVKVYDYFEENNTAYMVMEYVEGKTLKEVLNERGGVMSEDDAVGYIFQVLEALREVHKAGYLHRDIKPENIMVRANGEVVLVDFGIARQFTAIKTQSMTTLLTEGYAPLEQYGGRARFGPYTDIYALGATLYHLLTGQIPPPAPDRAHGVDLKPPHEVNSRVSRKVSEAVMKMMEMEVNKRPQDVDEVIGLLKAPEPTVQVPTKPSPPPTPPFVQPSPAKPMYPAPSRYLARKIGEKFGAISGALSGAVGGLGFGVLAGLLLIAAGAIIGVIVGGLGGAVVGAQTAGSGEEGCAAVLGGLIGGAIVGYLIGIFVGIILGLGASVGALAVGGVKGMQFGMRFGSDLSERWGAVPTSLVLSTITSAVIGIVWSGAVVYAYPDAMGEVFTFVVFVTAIGAVIGSVIGSLTFWSIVRQQGGQMPTAERMTALVSVPVGIGLAWLMFSLMPFSQRWWDVASLWERWYQKIEYQVTSRGSKTGFSPSYVRITPPSPVEFKIRYVQVAQANIRSGPGTEFSVITVVKKGQALKVIGISENGGWAKVELEDGRIGYISRKLLGVSPPK